MATLTIRNLPDEVHERLRGQAKRNRRSLNQEVIAELSAESVPESEARRVAAGKERMRRANEMIDAMRAQLPRLLTTDEIDEGIREGRK